MATTAKKPSKKVITKKSSKSQKAVKDTTAKGVMMETIVNRKIKYKYPANINGPLEKKAWRQKTRNKLKALTIAVASAKGAALTKAKKALATYEKQVLLA